GIVEGVGVFVAVLAAFGLALRWGHTAEDARAIAFTTLVVGNLALIWSNISSVKTVFETIRSRNLALWLVTLATITSLLAVLYVPYVRGIFAFSILHPNDLLVAFSLGAVSITWFEMLKLIRRKTRVQSLSSTGRFPKHKRVMAVTTGWLFVFAGVAG